MKRAVIDVGYNLINKEENSEEILGQHFFLFSSLCFLHHGVCKCLSDFALRTGCQVQTHIYASSEHSYTCLPSQISIRGVFRNQVGWGTPPHKHIKNHELLRKKTLFLSKEKWRKKYEPLRSRAVGAAPQWWSNERVMSNEYIIIPTLGEGDVPRPQWFDH